VRDGFVETNGIRLHYLEHEGDGPTLLLTHGLSANAHSLDVLAAHLAPALRVVVLDLRGRGESDRPETYSMADHAADVLGVLDAFGLERIPLGGHSFGGLLTLYIAANSPTRVEKALVLDVPGDVDPAVLDQIGPSLARLDQVYPSTQAFLEFARALPYFAGGTWSAELAAWYETELEEAPGGGVRSNLRPQHIRKCVEATFDPDWADLHRRIECPTLLVRSVEPFGPPGSPPILTAEGAARTLGRLRNGSLAEVPGNHITFVFGDNATRTAEAMLDFTLG
jgi:pimeloyl-ACP methyl ester carboxylesterase